MTCIEAEMIWPGLEGCDEIRTVRNAGDLPLLGDLVPY